VRGFSPALLMMKRGKLGRKAVIRYHRLLVLDLQNRSAMRLDCKLLAITTLMFVRIPAYAQTPQTTTPTGPPPVWTGNVGAGLAFTNGNTDTKNINISLGIVRDPKTRSVLRVNGLYLRGDKDSTLIVNQTQFTIRDEVNLSTRTFVFAQASYVRDTFKGIRNLFSPTAGIGYKLINTDATLLSIDTGIGGVWESDIGRPRVETGAYSAGERFAWKLSPTATVTQSIASLWKMNDWADSLHIFTAGIAVSITTHSQVKVEFLDSFKNRPPPAQPSLKKNDTSLITAFVWKF
jgi:putative salt-induced outer membrane protein YdiY